MKIFIDSADVDEIQQAYKWGVIDGVTTNPSLIKKAVDRRVGDGKKLDMKGYVAQILEMSKGNPVSLEVTERSAEGMIAQGKKLFEMFNPIAQNVNIKIPVNPALTDDEESHFDGIKAIRSLAGDNIPVNCTLVFTPEQALLAAKAGATFVSPFAGRVDDLLRKNAGMSFEKSDYYPAEGHDTDGGLLHDDGVLSGIDLVRQCVDVLDYYGFETEVLAASLRNPRQVREAALVGADIATLPFTVIQGMLKHVKTFEGMNSFMNDIVPEYAEL